MPAKYKIDSLTARVLPETAKRFEDLAKSKRAREVLPKTTKGTLLLSLVEMVLEDSEFQNVFFSKLGYTENHIENTGKPFRYKIVSEGELTLESSCTTLRSCRKSAKEAALRWRNTGTIQIIESDSGEVIEQIKFENGEVK